MKYIDTTYIKAARIAFLDKLTTNDILDVANGLEMNIKREYEENIHRKLCKRHLVRPCEKYDENN